MHTIGVIAEYNPFHSGHGHHLRMLSQTFGPDCAVVCVMMRQLGTAGDAALADKWTRAELALRQGADLILELPTTLGCLLCGILCPGRSGASTATGVVDTLSFGSEAGILSPLQAVADCLESEAWRCLLRQTLAQGLSFPVARQRAATALLGENAQCLRHPNNNLGIEYLRALRSLGSPLVPHTIPRLGAGHDQGQTGLSHVSASYLRERLLEEPGETSLAPISPPGGSAPAGQPCQPGILHPGGFGPSAGHGGRRLSPTT
ncbi:MAG: nucleotidyltransferase family protein [Evtepia gabavorous]